MFRSSRRRWTEVWNRWEGAIYRARARERERETWTTTLSSFRPRCPRGWREEIPGLWGWRFRSPRSEGTAVACPPCPWRNPTPSWSTWPSRKFWNDEFLFFLQEQVYKGAYTRRKIIFSNKSFDQCCLIIFHFEIKFSIELLFSRRIRNTLFILRDIMREKLVEEEIRRTCCEHWS